MSVRFGSMPKRGRHREPPAPDAEEDGECMLRKKRKKKAWQPFLLLATFDLISECAHTDQSKSCPSFPMLFAAFLVTCGALERFVGTPPLLGIASASWSYP